MLLGGIIAGNLLPWALLSPALPLLIILIRKTHENRATMALAMLCVVSILSHLFMLLAVDQAQQQNFQKLSFLAELFFTGLLLKYCTDHQVLKYATMVFILMFASVFASFLILQQQSDLYFISLSGVLVIFTVSILVLLSKFNKLEQNLIFSADFWFTGGIFFHFGLLSLLFLTGKNITDLDYHQQNDFSLLYVIIFVIQFLFFTAGVLIRQSKNGK